LNFEKNNFDFYCFFQKNNYENIWKCQILNVILLSISIVKYAIFQKLKNMKNENEVRESKKIDRTKLNESLKNVNLDKLTEKATKGREIWKKEFKASYDAKNEKRARRLIRNVQKKLSRKLLSDINLNMSDIELKADAKDLENFYKSGLIDFSVFSNISENSEYFAIVQNSYKAMKEILAL